jgi:2,3,4,5-tetrahydropyridine-2-carboxylate N-succinyltransferase
MSGTDLRELVAGTADGTTGDGAAVLRALEAGDMRAAEPDSSAASGWRVNADVKAAILRLFADRTGRDWTVGPLWFRDRAGIPPREPAAWADRDDLRVVPGGTSVRAGVHLGDDVVLMPPSFLNVGAWVGAGTMVDSHVLVGSCAQVGDRVHLSAGVLIGGVLEPAGARPVIVEDDAFVGAGSILLDGVIVGPRAVIGAGVVLTGTSTLVDVVEETVLRGTPEAPLVVPAGAVVVPGVRAVHGEFAAAHGVAIATPLIVKRRDRGTDARVALEAALR